MAKACLAQCKPKARCYYSRMKKTNTSKPILHIAHANGFPGGSYATLAAMLGDSFEVHAFDRVGHGDFPVRDNWAELTAELIAYFETFDEPVIAVGHSLGGVLSLKVAIERPDLVRALIMLDSPLLTQLQTAGLWLVKSLGKIDKVTGGARASARRQHWGSVDEAREYLAGKKLFRDFDPRCLSDCAVAGTHSVGDGVELYFDRDVEAAIFRTLPHNLKTPKDFDLPAAVVGGTNSEVLTRKNAQVMRKKLGMKVRWIEGGHLFPFERPDLTVKTIKELTKSFGLID